MTSCFDVMCDVMCQTPYGGHLTYQRSFTNSSPLKKKYRLDVGGQPTPVNINNNNNNVNDVIIINKNNNGCTSSSSSSSSSEVLIGTTTPLNVDGLKPETDGGALSVSAVTGIGHRGSGGGSFSFLSPNSSSSSSASSSSSSLVVLKSESNAVVDDDDDDEEEEEEEDESNPVRKQRIAGNCVLLTYFAEDIDTNIDNHFTRALQQSQQQHQQPTRNGFDSEGCGKSQLRGRSCCRQTKDELSSPLSLQRSNFPSSFWNSAAYRSPAAAAASAARGWSSLMVPPPPPAAAAFSVASNPDAAACAHYHLNTHFPSATSPCAMVGLGSLHHGAQDPWGSYPFSSSPPPSTYRGYRHSIHEFSFAAAAHDAPGSGVVGHLGPAAGMHGRYKSFLAPPTAAAATAHGRFSSTAHDDDLKAAADVWRTRCYGYSDMSPSHLATGFSLSGGIEVAPNDMLQTPVKDVYWF